MPTEWTPELAKLYATLALTAAKECQGTSEGDVAAEKLLKRLAAILPTLMPKATVKALFDADHHDHFAARMSDSEMAALAKMEAWLKDTPPKP